MTLAPNLSTSIQYLKGVGPKRAEILAQKGIHTLYDLLYTLPRKHYDRSQIKPIGQTSPGQDVTIEGTVEDVRVKRTRRLAILEVDVRDETGLITAIWFNQPYMSTAFSAGDHVIVAGKIDFFRVPQIKPREFEIIYAEDTIPIHTKGIIPAYSQIAGMGSKGYRRLVYRAVMEHAPRVPELFPVAFLKQRRMLPAGEALRKIHFPETQNDLIRARDRLAYEELFLQQTLLALRKNRLKLDRVTVPLRLTQELDFHIRRLFPFALTGGQEQAIADIRRDLVRPHPMNRLLQGDVGCGKTVVAAYALLCAIGNHTQAAFMAPTEILAEQHFLTLTRMLEHSRVRMTFLGKGTTRTERKDRLAQIREGKCDLVVGTHAIIQDEVTFKKLSLAVIDEQHKFGVRQRAALRAKGRAPHTLTMTATPIPRTLSMAMFGDLEITTITDMPPGRKPVRTMFRPSSQLSSSFEFIAKKIKEGCQVYFVYPLIDDSDKVPLKSAQQMSEFLKERFPRYRVALLHGSLAGEEKASIMESFRSGKIHVLVSTVVIEVGIDVPNATMMVIEHAERYGLAQLHQLRGRIARGTREGYFLLFGDPATDAAKERIQTLVATQDGFKIAEKDLALRGPGELLGLEQSGWPEFKAADLTRDVPLLIQAHKDATALVKSDPQLKRPAYAAIRTALRERYRESWAYLTSG